MSWSTLNTSFPTCTWFVSYVCHDIRSSLAVLHESRLAELPAWNGKQKRVRDLPPEIFTKSEGFPTILFLYRSVKSLSRLLWISQVGALTELAQPVLASSECCSNYGHDNSWGCALFENLKLKINNEHGGSKNELGKERAREKTTTLWVLHFILHFD